MNVMMNKVMVIFLNIFLKQKQLLKLKKFFSPSQIFAGPKNHNSQFTIHNSQLKKFTIKKIHN